MSQKEELETLLKKHGQEHLIQFWDDLTDEERKVFAEDLLSIDYDNVTRLCDKALEDLKSAGLKKDNYMEPIPADHVVKKDAMEAATLQNWWDAGLKEISEGAVAVVLLAGGQGTRLGVDYPKGMYNVGLPSGKTLYQLQAERILKLETMASKKYEKKCAIKWYIMTSAATLSQTREYFEKNSYFGLDESNVTFFEQFLLPCLTFEGKLILASKGSLAKAPDGNGGLYLALHKHGVLEEMSHVGVKHVHIYCVDNILVHPADPSFTGFVMSKNADAANKVIEKVDPNEAVGVTCQCQGKVQVVEYSEITAETASKRASDGSLFFKDSNICLHYFSLDFLKRFVRDHLDEMPHHIAKKKIPHVDSTGTVIKPTEPNGIKLEKFVFDVFEFSSNFCVYEVERVEEFSPLKNGPDNPKSSSVSCKKDLCSLHMSYLKAAGAKFVKGAGETNDLSETICEISPLLSFSGEGLEEFKGREFIIGSTIHLQPDVHSPNHKKTKV